MAGRRSIPVIGAVVALLAVVVSADDPGLVSGASPGPGAEPTPRPAWSHGTFRPWPAGRYAVTVEREDGPAIDLSFEVGMFGPMSGDASPPEVEAGRSATSVIDGVGEPTDSISTPRARPAAVRLDDGRVLVVGGVGGPDPDDDDATPATAELYDPETGTSSPTGSMVHGTWEGQAGVLLPDGRVLVLHGRFGIPAEIYDPATGTFEQVGAMATGPANRAFPLPDGRVLYYFHHDHGGRIWGCRIGIIEPSTGLSTRSHCGLTDPLVSPLSDGRFLVLERHGNATQPAARILDPLTGAFSLDVGQPHIMALAAAPLPDGRMIVVGPGAAESFDPATGEFSAAGRPALSSESTWVSDTLALPDGRVLIYHSMHQGESPPAPSLEVYDPTSDTFTALRDDLPSEASLTLLADGRILLAGGSASPATMVISAGASSPAIGEGPALTWTKVDLDAFAPSEPDPRWHGLSLSWLGDRFGLVDESTGALSTSTDGLDWVMHTAGDSDAGYAELLRMGASASWRGDAIGWDPPGGPMERQKGIVRVVRSPEEPTQRSFDGSVGAAGVGPAGFVVRVHSALDFDAFITSLMGDAWAEHMVSFAYEDGVLRITTDDDRSLEIDWADHGFEPGDVADRGFGWYSHDGLEWIAIPGFPANVSEVIGVSDGFIARGYDGRCDGCAETTEPWGMWHSPDGLTWRRIGAATEGSLLPWRGAVLVADGPARFDVWTSAGRDSLPMTATLPAPWPAFGASTGVGPLGLVALENDREVLHSPDGVAWSIEPLPEAMAAAGGGRRPASIAVGERSVAVLLWSDDGSPVPSLWVGSRAP